MLSPRVLRRQALRLQRERCARRGRSRRMNAACCGRRRGTAKPPETLAGSRGWSARAPPPALHEGAVRLRGDHAGAEPNRGSPGGARPAPRRGEPDTHRGSRCARASWDPVGQGAASFMRRSAAATRAERDRRQGPRPRGWSRPLGGLSDQRWSGKWGSNPRPRAWEARALPTELFPPTGALIAASARQGRGFRHRAPKARTLAASFAVSRRLAGRPSPRGSDRAAWCRGARSG